MYSRIIVRSALARGARSRVVPSVRQNSKRRFCSKGEKCPVGADTKAKVNSAAPPPPPPSEGGSGNGMYLLLLAALGGGAYYFKDDIYKQLGWDKKSEVPKVKDEILPEKVKKELDDLETRLKKAEPEKVKEQKVENVIKATAPSQETVTPVSGPVDYEAVRKAIVELLDAENYDDGSYGPVFVRLAWHNAGTYDKNTKKGGSEGAGMRFAVESSWGANAGLEVARARLEPVKAKFPGITYSDLWSLAGTVALEEMGAPKMNWRPGRKDYEEGAIELPNGLLPDADGRDKKDKPSDHLRDIFYRMGFNDQEIVILSGGHAIGRCHPDRSGYWGPWTYAPTTFSNEFYRLLLEERWSKKRTHKGKEWTGPEQYENPSGELMMLPTDLSLVWDDKFRPYVEKYAKDEEQFFKDFAKAWIKLQENGVRKFHGRRRYYFFGPRE